jgi:hypothetical protein
MFCASFLLLDGQIGHLEVIRDNIVGLDWITLRGVLSIR